MRKKFVAGNWKMNKLPSEVPAYFESFMRDLAGYDSSRAEVLFAVPFTHLEVTRRVCDVHGLLVAAQNIHQMHSGAFTGEVSLPMLKDLGIRWTLVGHSERRLHFGESSDLVAAKAHASQKADLTPIICVGETLQERQDVRTEAVLGAQLSAVVGLIDRTKPFVVAYEPVWAIGTGMTATTDQAQTAHAFIRKFLSDSLGASLGSSQRILYGGSVNGTNAQALMSQSDIDGALVGGASLTPAEFAKIVRSA